MRPSELKEILGQVTCFLDAYGLDDWQPGVIDIHIGYMFGKDKVLQYGGTIQVSEELFDRLGCTQQHRPGVEVFRNVEHKNLYRTVYPRPYIKLYCCRSVQKEYDGLATEMIYNEILAEK